MPGRVILFLGVLLCCAFLAAQAPTASVSPSPSAIKGKAKANLVEAKLALDAAKRWTQAALEDDSNLLPIERDLLLVRLAASWKDADHARAQEYFKAALGHLRSTSPDTPVAQAQMYFLVTSISSELHSLDSNAWEELITTLPKYAAADTISRQAQDLIDSNDIKGAMELEKKSLDRGGSESDANTLDWMIQRDSGEAARLFDQMLTTAAKPESDPNLLLMLAQNAFSDREDDQVQTFFNGERQKRLLDLLGQVILSGNDAGGCTYSSLITPFMSRFSPDQQDQLQAVARNCSEVAKSTFGLRLNPDANTDDLISAMNEASSPKKKASLRQQAARRAADIDHDYEKAIQLCLGASEEERKAAVGSQDLFDHWATVFASAGIRASAQKNDIDGLQRFLDLLPARIKASPEMDAVRLLAKQDRPKARALLADARALLEIYESDHGPSGSERTYIQLLFETARVSPDDIPDAWRIVVVGLNRLERARRTETKSTATSTAIRQEKQPFPNALYPFTVPAAAVADEGFARASIEDLDSVAYREELRLGVIGTFLESYQTAIKASQPGSAIVAPDS